MPGVEGMDFALAVVFREPRLGDTKTAGTVAMLIDILPTSVPCAHKSIHRRRKAADVDMRWFVRCSLG